MCQWDLSTELIVDPLWYKDFKKLSGYKLLCLLPPKRCIYKSITLSEFI